MTQKTKKYDCLHDRYCEHQSEKMTCNCLSGCSFKDEVEERFNLVGYIEVYKTLKAAQLPKDSDLIRQDILKRILKCIELEKADSTDVKYIRKRLKEMLLSLIDHL